jgi:hypothetical protein
MKYMLLMNYAPVPGVPPMGEWAPEEVKAHGDAMGAIHAELTERGELVATEGLAGPGAAKIVTHDGVGAPVVTDGPFPESKEFLAGYCSSTSSRSSGRSRSPRGRRRRPAPAASRWRRRSRCGR